MQKCLQMLQCNNDFAVRIGQQQQESQLCPSHRLLVLRYTELKHGEKTNPITGSYTKT